MAYLSRRASRRPQNRGVCSCLVCVPLRQYSCRVIMHRCCVWLSRRTRKGVGPMEHAEHRSRAVFARSATASLHPHLRASISNRQLLVRLENAATHRNQTPEANPNRHFWEGYCAPVRARISRFGRPALNSTPYTSRSRNHRNSFKTLARAHFYYVQMDQISRANGARRPFHPLRSFRPTKTAGRRAERESLRLRPVAGPAHIESTAYSKVGQDEVEAGMELAKEI
jgi:hypothetical protein